mgnify:CR=1 FL=1
MADAKVAIEQVIADLRAGGYKSASKEVQNIEDITIFLAGKPGLGDLVDSVAELAVLGIAEDQKEGMKQLVKVLLVANFLMSIAQSEY